MPVAHGSRSPYVSEWQPEVVLSQANPVQNQWYDILGVTQNVRLYALVVYVDTADETLEGRVTIDGQVKTGGVAATFGTPYYGRVVLYDVMLALTAINYNFGLYSAIDARSLKIEMRKTTNNGNGNLHGVVTYGKW
jgi:hypothetical protein